MPKPAENPDPPVDDPPKPNDPPEDDEVTTQAKALIKGVVMETLSEFFGDIKKDQTPPKGSKRSGPLALIFGDGD